MRRFLLTLAVLAATSGSASAQSFPTPEALLEAFYEPYSSGDFAADDAVFRSAALNALYDADAQSTPEGEIGTLDFDPYVDGQDYDLSNHGIRTTAIEGNRATVDVTFENFGQPIDLTYLLVDEDGWKIDDVISNNPANPYRLTQIFTGEGAAE